jgi:hypothetical protein
MIANFNHNHQKILGASWKAVVLAFPVVWGKKVGCGDTTERRTYPCTQVHTSRRSDLGTVPVDREIMRQKRGQLNFCIPLLIQFPAATAASEMNFNMEP